MVSKLRLAGTFVCALIICLIIWYTLAPYELFRTPSQPDPPHPDSVLCRWPPTTPNDIRTTSNTYNITICVHKDSQSLAIKSDPTYSMKSLCRDVTSNRSITFKEFGECDPSICKSPIYPDVYRTYPQDVPIKEILRSIKSGVPVSEA
ncbi:unnamed protein product, partial [Hydatigera taeniaeformis]|uniref:Secreted protein n=1 Tax=Hydatigena taeniaeformis TaxID=6205 RepID=A0A0R3WW00_HYDTA